ncbi:MAG: hypothetical protein ACM3SX_06760 [Deltaproteobacteria bacterium]
MSTDLVIGVVLGVAFLYVFYRAVQAEWPENYFAASDVSAYAVSITPVRYALFRLVPVYLTCVVVAVFLDRAGSLAPAGAVLVGALHAILTLGRALLAWALSTRVSRQDRNSVALLRTVVFVSVLAVSLVAAATFQVFDRFVPSAENIMSALWTAIFAGIIGAYLVRVSRGPLSAEDLAQRSLGHLPRKLLDFAGDLAAQSHADSVLVQAIMVVENIQRPHWFRVLERLKSPIIKHGTYGIMQVESDHLLTDEQSIQRAVAERLTGVRVSTPSGQLNTKALRDFASRYNADANFADLLENAYLVIQRRNAVSN